MPPSPRSLVLQRAQAAFRRASVRMFATAMEDGISQMRDLCRAAAIAADPRVLDLGCWDGLNTIRIAPDSVVIGSEVDFVAANQARILGIAVVRADLEQGIPFGSGSFDVVFSNQVIEHLCDTDVFVSETFRVLRPGGTAIIATENMSSWHNLGALALGWQAFSLTNVTQRAAGIGNPLAALRSAAWGPPETGTGWQHRRIFSFRGLLELFQVHGFEDVCVHASGYYPLPSRVARLDPRHGAFITVEARRPQ